MSALPPPDRRPTGRAVDRGRVPPGIERTSEAAWRDFEACCAAADKRLAQLRASAAQEAREAIRRASTGLLPAGAMQVRSSAVRLRPAVTLELVLELARRNGRVCPRPGPWRCLYALLPQAREQGMLVRAPLPIGPELWELTSDLRKQLALRAQIDWAQRHGALARLHDCLAALREQDWHHRPALLWPPTDGGPRG